jgi:hypothetical protein
MAIARHFLNGVDNFKHSPRPKNFWPRAKQNVFYRYCHAVFQGLDAVFPLLCQFERKNCHWTSRPFKQAPCRSGKPKTFRRVLALRRRVA